MAYLFAFDLDATVLPDYRVLEPRLQGAVSRARAAGHRCMIATARPLPCAKWVWDALELDTPICLQNGARLMHPGDPTYPEAETVISAETVESALTAVFSRWPDAHVFLEYGDQLRVTRMPQGGYFGVLAEDCDTHLFSADCIPHIPAARIGVFLSDLDALQACADHFAPDTGLHIIPQPKFADGPRCLIYPRAADKWHAVARVAGEMGIPRENIVTFGDAWNDFTMLREAGQGYALLGSAAADQPDIPHTTRLRCAEGGVADIIDLLTQASAHT